MGEERVDEALAQGEEIFVFFAVKHGGRCILYVRGKALLGSKKVDADAEDDEIERAVCAEGALDENARRFFAVDINIVYPFDASVLFCRVAYRLCNGKGGNVGKKLRAFRRKSGAKQKAHRQPRFFGREEGAGEPPVAAALTVGNQKRALGRACARHFL